MWALRHDRLGSGQARLRALLVAGAGALVDRVAVVLLVAADVFLAVVFGAETRLRAGFATPRPGRTARRDAPVWLAATAAPTSGGPSATMVPPPVPPSGPMSTIQSAVLITSRLCSMTITVLPVSTRAPSTPRSFRMSSKWRPVVGSSRM